MPTHMLQWDEVVVCPLCALQYSKDRPPVSLPCGHTICRVCLCGLEKNICPFDKAEITTNSAQLPLNWALLRLVHACGDTDLLSSVPADLPDEQRTQYVRALFLINDIAQLLRPLSALSSPTVGRPADTDLSKDKNNNNSSSSSSGDNSADETAPPTCNDVIRFDQSAHRSDCDRGGASQAVVGGEGGGPSILSLPIQRRLVTIITCQPLVAAARWRSLRACRSVGERAALEILLSHQQSSQLARRLWPALRARGCQFLGPAMQEDVLQLLLLALEDGHPLSRNVLVLYVVQRLRSRYPHVSRSSVGHVVQLLFRASCFQLLRQEGDSSLMTLRPEYRSYECLRREHDTQIVQLAIEAGLRVAPDQWSNLLYGDILHRAHMQSIVDRLQSASSFNQYVRELEPLLLKSDQHSARDNNQHHFQKLLGYFQSLAGISVNVEQSDVSWSEFVGALEAVLAVVSSLLGFIQQKGSRSSVRS